MISPLDMCMFLKEKLKLYNVLLLNACLKILRTIFDLSAEIIGPKSQALETKNFEINGLKYKIYRPLTNHILPVIIYYHGGGWMVGSIKAYDRIMQYISFKAQAVVVGVEYRKAPEHKISVTLLDAKLAYFWVINNLKLIGGNKNKIAIVGDSAGGHIAINLWHKIHRLNIIKPKLMALIYPVVDLNIHELRLMKKHNSFLIRKLGVCILLYVLRHNIGGLKKINFAFTFKYSNKIKYPKVFLMTAQIDPLTHSIEKFGKKLKKAGCTVLYKHYPKTIHGFINFAGVSKIAAQALEDLVIFLKNNL
jgi:acetyl esterase